MEKITKKIKTFFKKYGFWIKLLFFFLLFLLAWKFLKRFGKGLLRFFRGECIGSIAEIERIDKEREKIRSQYVEKKDVDSYTRAESCAYIRSVLKRMHE